MNSKESVGFLNLTSMVSNEMDFSSEEKELCQEEMEVFFDAFGESLTDSLVQRMGKLFLDLHNEYVLSFTQIRDIISLFKAIFFSENSPENCIQYAKTLEHFFVSQNFEIVTNTQLSRLCIKLLFPAIYDINAEMPVEPNLYFMQPRKGLNESFRYFYRRLEKNYPHHLALYEFHRDTVTPAEYFINAAFFIKDMAVAKAVFVHESNNLMGYLNIRPETKIVQLWHGCGVFKHIGLSTAGKKGFKTSEKYVEFPEYNKYSLVTIASPELTWVFEEFMGIPREKNIIQPLGVCRTDEFFDNGYVERCYKKLYKAIPDSKKKKIILYAPTYRGVDPNRVSPDKLDIEQFAKELGDEYILIMKHHQTVKNVPEIPESCRDTFAYDMTRGKGMNINELMTVADICITDYSSVAFEFSLFERPLLFFVYDLEEYIDNRGLYYNFEEITPGPLCRTTEEMIDYIKNVDDKFEKSVVIDFKNRFMCSCDGHACERVINYLELGHYVYYDGNGATQETFSNTNTEKDSVSMTELEPGIFRLQSYTSHPITEGYQLYKNPFVRENYCFSGWNMYQFVGNTKYWLCMDGEWHSKKEIEKTFLNKRLFQNEEMICDISLKNDYSVFLEAQWTYDFRPDISAFDGFLTQSQEECIGEMLSELYRENILLIEQIKEIVPLLRTILLNGNRRDTRAQAVKSLNKILALKDPEALTSAEVTAMARFCIKKLLPVVYDINKQKPVEDKLFFMQPRKGMNETFRFIHQVLEQSYPYKLALYELGRGTVSLAEYYINAAFFAKDMATAKAVFVHESNNLMGYLNIRSESKVVQLWHGCGVFKHIGLSTANKKGFKTSEKYVEFPEYNKYSLVTIASPELTWVFEEFMGISGESGIIQPLGVCRTDEIFNEGYVENCYKKLHKIIPASKGKKVILYAPTYRGLNSKRVSPDALDIERFAEALGDEYILIMKHHQTVKTLPEIPLSCKDKFAYDMTRGKGMNINELMTVADICITDYSSVAFEFSMFERPLIFFVYDLDEYIDNRGLYYNFEEITPGPLCRTNEEMIRYIKNIEESFDKSVIIDFKNKFMCSCDGHACERTISFLKLGNYLYYTGNGATKEMFSSEIGCGCENAKMIKTQSGDFCLLYSLAEPITGKYQIVKNVFERKDYLFTGWNMYQFEGTAKYWLCEDGSWHSDKELIQLSTRKKCFGDQETIIEFPHKNSYPVFLEAQWKERLTLGTLKRHILTPKVKKNLEKRLRKLYKKIFQ